MRLGPSRGALSEAQNGQGGTPAQSRYMMDVESAPESFRSAVGMFGLHARAPSMALTAGFGAQGLLRNAQIAKKRGCY
jgi:hypothetical protein